MKKNYTFILVLLLLSARYLGQLNGIYTINNSIAASSTNFTSFATFAASLNVGGVSGPVTVNVLTNGTFNEQVNFLQAPGISATNSVLINGNGATITFNATSATLLHTILLSGADYMTFNNLNVVGTGGTYALACHLWNGANNNTFNNCTFTSPIVGTVVGLCPFSASGSSVTVASAGNCGNNNTVNSCTMTGGYYSTVFYGASASPFNTGNMVLNSTVRDFYTYGLYNLYCQGTVFKGNVVDRLNRTTVTTTYAIYFSTGSIANGLIEGNHVRQIFSSAPGASSTAYCIYITTDASLNNENVVRNNIVSDIKTTGTIYGIYLSGAAFAHAFHNTVSLDDATSTGGAVYGIYATGPNEKVKNNIVTIAKGGTGAKNGIAITAATTNLEMDFNDVFISTTTGAISPFMSAAVGYSLPAWKIAFPNYDQGSKDEDPMYTNPSLMNYVPTSTVINNMCPFIGVITDITGFVRSTATPDPGAYETYTTPCIGSAPANSIVTPTIVACPNSTLNISLANSFTNTGYSVQWQASTNNILGPYTAIPGATLPTFNTGNLSATIYYNALIYCVNGGGTVTATPGQVQVALPTLNTVPYYEGFEGISTLNQLPNCSWSTNTGGSALTYTSNGTSSRYPKSGTKFASFSNTPSGANYFYSNGIYMSPGITYSAALWYINESVGYNPWTEISINIGAAQTPTALFSVVSTTAGTFGYTLLSGTFTVATAGIYYVGIKAIPGPNSSPYLSWDDLSITIPCQLNSPPLNVNNLSTTICSNQSLVFSASGANTYTWTSNQSGTNVVSYNPIVSVSPSINTTYYVIGTSTLSGCTSTVTRVVTVLQAPPVAVFATSLSICEGQSTTLYAQGANTYNWAHGVLGSPVVVTPNTSTTYSVMGVSNNGCSSLQTIVINVNSVPTVQASASSYQLCKGESVTLTGSGAASYMWSSNAALVQYGNPLVTIVQASGAYTVTGTDANGCTGTANFILNVDECTGINEIGAVQGNIGIYPNPGTGIFNVWSSSQPITTVELFDLAGKQVYSQKVNQNNAELNVSSLPAGIYSVRVKTPGALNYLKVVKLDQQ